MARKCVLKCLSNLHPPIVLPHNQSYVIGRSKETKIKSKRCSKTQVELLADYTSYTVIVRQLGPNVTGVNNKGLLFGNTALSKHSDILEILLGEYHHRIEFDPPPDTASSKSTCHTTDIEMPRRKTVAAVNPVKNKFSEDNDNKQSNQKRLKATDNPDKGEGGWETYADGDLLVFKKNMAGRSKIAGYDMDGTLIVTKSGNVFAKDYNDWKIIYSEVPGKLKKLHQDGYKIIIFTNQAGIAAGKHSVAGVQRKISSIIERLGVPIQAFVSTGKGEYRKPALGMWNFLKNEI